MKKIVLLPFLCLLLAVINAPVYASITIEVSIDDSLHVSFDFSNLNSTMYNEIQAHPEIFNSTSIPRTIVRNLEKQDLRQVSWRQDSTAIFKGNGAIRVEFYLEGQDILSFTVNKVTFARTYTVKTNWIKFDVNLTNTFTLNFTTYFAPSISSWQRINHTVNGIVHQAFYYNSTVSTAPFNASCYFILPTAATNIRASGDTLTFEMPPSLEDRLINSPILILGAVIVANIIAVIYRKVRK